MKLLRCALRDTHGSGRRIRRSHRRNNAPARAGRRGGKNIQATVLGGRSVYTGRMGLHPGSGRRALGGTFAARTFACAICAEWWVLVVVPGRRCTRAGPVPAFSGYSKQALTQKGKAHSREPPMQPANDRYIALSMMWEESSVGSRVSLSEAGVQSRPPGRWVQTALPAGEPYTPGFPRSF